MSKLKDMEPLENNVVLKTRYKIQKVIGCGGTGFVYNAFDLVQGFDVAIKELCPISCCKRGSDGRSIVFYSEKAAKAYEVYKNYFIQEIEVLSKFKKYPNFLKQGDLFEENNTYYYMMEILDGITLKTRLRDSKIPLSEKEIVHIALEVLKALSCLHRDNLVHRDVCADNIFLTTNGVVKLIDFGAVLNFKTSKSFSVVLKTNYAPPEQYSSHGFIGPWTDIYSLGVVMYEAVTKKKVIQALERLYGIDLIPPIQINKCISNSLNIGIMKALNLNIKERFQTADEFYAYLKDIQFQEDLMLINEKKTIIEKDIKKIVFVLVSVLFLIASCIVLLFLVNV